MASYKAGLSALRAEKEALAQQNGQTWQLLEERTNEIHRLQVSSPCPLWMNAQSAICQLAKAGLSALHAEKEALAQQNGQTWQLLEERTNEIHRLQVGPHCLLAEKAFQKSCA